MPSKNITKQYTPNTYYHVYNRGVNKGEIFRDKQDYAVMLNLLKRHLSPEIIKDKQGREYRNFKDEIDLLAFCLMPNHFHLFIYQEDNINGISRLMSSLMTSYSMYFNKRYDRIGPLFQARYKAVRIVNEAQLWHISRYIHLNPLDINRDYKKYPYSSYRAYMGGQSFTWLNTSKILSMHLEENNNYEKFVADYLGYRQDLKEEKLILADL